MNIIGRREEFHNHRDEHAHEFYSSGFNANPGMSDLPSSRFIIAKGDCSVSRNTNAGGQSAPRTRLDIASEKVVHTKNAETESANGSAADS